jgi:hypothetical protein
MALVGNMSNRHVDAIHELIHRRIAQDEHQKPLTLDQALEQVVKGPETKEELYSKFFISELRFIIFTVLVLMTTLMLQKTGEAAVLLMLPNSAGMRVIVLLMFSVGLMLITIGTVLAWKPPRFSS